MTKTLTTEQLEERAKLFRKKAAAENTSSRQSVAMLYAEVFEELIEARELLANREAQPVLYASEETLAYAKEGEKSLVTWSEPMGDAVIPLFTAPPAPVVNSQLTGATAVPDFKALAENLVENLVDCGGADEKAVEQYLAFAEKTCRAAMLAQPVSQGCKLPDNVREALTLALQAMEFMGDTLNNIDAVCTEDVEYVTPAFTAVRGLLAAAPEVAVPTTKINCWSCKKSMTTLQLMSSDGICPHCNVEIDTEDDDE